MSASRLLLAVAVVLLALATLLAGGAISPDGSDWFTAQTLSLGGLTLWGLSKLVGD